MTGGRGLPALAGCVAASKASCGCQSGTDPSPLRVDDVDALLGPAAQLLALVGLGAVPNAVAGYNLLLLSSFFLSAVTTAWVLRRSGRAWTAAALGLVLHTRGLQGRPIRQRLDAWEAQFLHREVERVFESAGDRVYELTGGG